MKPIIIGLTFLLVACSSTKNIPTANVPIVQGCLKERPSAPLMKFDYLPQAKSEPEAAEHLRILWQDRQNLLLHVIAWEVAASGCEVK